MQFQSIDSPGRAALQRVEVGQNCRFMSLRMNVIPWRSPLSKSWVAFTHRFAMLEVLVSLQCPPWPSTKPSCHELSCLPHGQTGDAVINVRDAQVILRTRDHSSHLFAEQCRTWSKYLDGNFAAIAQLACIVEICEQKLKDYWWGEDHEELFLQQ